MRIKAKETVMVKRSLLHKFFLRALSAVHWNKVGSKRIEVMKKEVPKILEMLARYIERDARFILKYGNQTSLADKVTCVPHNWHMDLADPNDVDINQNVFAFLGLMQAQAKCALFDEASLNRLLENIPLATYVLTNFFLNNGKHFIVVDTAPFVTCLTTTCKSGTDIEKEVTTSPDGGLSIFLRGSPAFMSSPATGRMRLATVCVKDLSFYGSATYEEVHQRLKNLGYFLCPPQLIWQLNLDEMLAEFAGGVTFRVMMEGIDVSFNYSSEKDRKVPKEKGHNAFEFYTDSKGIRFLRCCDGHVFDLLPVDTNILLCLDNPFSKKETYREHVQSVHAAWVAAGGDIRLARIESDRQVEAERWDPDRVNPRTFDSPRPGMTGTLPRVEEDYHGL